MKLVRLTTTDSNVFSNDIQGDLILEKDSQICLLNAHFEKKEITYTTSNDIFKYKIGTATFTETEELINTTYDKSNFKLLTRDIEDKLNESLDVGIPGHAGSNFLVKRTVDNHLEIITEYGYVMNPYSSSKFENVGVEDTTGGTVYQKADGGSEETPDAMLGSNRLVAYDGLNGCGYFRFKLNQLPALGTSNGVYIGLSAIEPENMGGNFPFNTTNIKFGIHARNTTSGYDFIAQGVEGTSAFFPENSTPGSNDNDVLCIEATNGVVEGVIYSDSQPDGVGQVLFSEKYNGNLALFPIIGFFSQTDVSIRDIQYTPYDDVDEDVVTINNNLLLGDPLPTQVLVGTPQPPTQDSDRKTPMVFEFPNQTLTNFLGFKNSLITLPVPDDSFSLKSDKPLQFTDIAETYIVELMNLQVESFDGYLEQRKSILSVVNNVRESTLDDVVFISNNLIWLDLNNSFESVLRNIDVRIVTDTYRPVDIQNRANMTILIKKKGE